MKRVLLARSGSLATRQRVYRIADGLEVDEVDHYEVRRSRVFYDDVLLMTYHRTRSPWVLAISGIFGALFSLMSYAFGTREPVVGWWFFVWTAAPLLLIFVLRLLFGVDEINVYGRRSQARMRFWFRKARARRIFQEISSEVRARQDAMRRATAVAPPAPRLVDDANPEEA